MRKLFYDTGIDCCRYCTEGRSDTCHATCRRYAEQKAAWKIKKQKIEEAKAKERLLDRRKW